MVVNADIPQLIDPWKWHDLGIEKKKRENSPPIAGRQLSNVSFVANQCLQRMRCTVVWFFSQL